MARLYYECNTDLRNDTEEDEIIKPYACTPDKYCLYCCCNSQCCLLVQRRPPRHFWEAWYFWLGVALLAVFIISSVSDPRRSLISQSFLDLRKENKRREIVPLVSVRPFGNSRLVVYNPMHSLIINSLSRFSPF